MRLRRRYLILALFAGAAVFALPAFATETPSVEAVSTGLYSHAWSPGQVSIATGGTVTISNASMTTPHGVEWVGGPEKPACSSGVPVGTTAAASGTNWSGTCTFSKAGTYTFYCTVHGPEMTETVTVANAGAPAASTGAASAVGETEAMLQGNVNPGGHATTYYFEYGTTSSYGARTSEESAGEASAGKAVSATIDSLTPGVVYHYRLVAKNAVETVFGSDRSFTTKSPPAAPSATTTVASGIGESEASLQGSVGPNGEATTYYFEWGTTSGYGQVTAEFPAGEDQAIHTESAHLSGLAAGTVYHYRIVAKSALGTRVGSDQTFTTESAPSPPSSPPASSPEQPSPPASPGPPPSQPALPIVVPSGPVLPQSVPLGAVTVRATQHGSQVKGALEIPAAAAGGRLEIDLLARGTSVRQGSHSATVLVGRLVRSSTQAGKVSFVVKLSTLGRRALSRHHHLALSVKVVLKSKQGKTTTVTRSVALSS